MRIILFTKAHTVGRFVDLVLELAGRGTEVVVAMPARDWQRPIPEVLVTTTGVRRESYKEFATRSCLRSMSLLRRTRDYVWYLRPEHGVATFNRKRALDGLLKACLKTRPNPSWPDPALGLDPAVQSRIETMLAELESHIPADAGILRFLAELEPDGVLVTPLIRPGQYQTEVLKAARSLGVPSGFPVSTWDSLSNKG